jgi:hypothetical protein
MTVKPRSQTLSTDIITMYPHGFKVVPYGDAETRVRDNYEKSVGTEVEEFYLVAAFISSMVQHNQRSSFASLEDKVRGEIAKEWFLLSKGDYRASREEPNVVY